MVKQDNIMASMRYHFVRLRSARAEIGLHKCTYLSGYSLSTYCAYINANLVHVQVSKGNSQTLYKRNVHLFE